MVLRLNSKILTRRASHLDVDTKGRPPGGPKGNWRSTVIWTGGLEGSEEYTERDLEETEFSSTYPKSTYLRGTRKNGGPNQKNQTLWKEGLNRDSEDVSTT